MKPGIVAACILALVFLQSYDLPKGWHKAGDAPGKYESGLDKSVVRKGATALTIKSASANAPGFCTVMRSSLPGNFVGKRIRMTGFVKSKNVKKYAGLWMRVDGNGKERVLSFDNMSDRPIKGTTEWAQYTIILDVPEGATNISYGALLSGAGQIWFDDIRFVIVRNNVETTGMHTLGK